MLSELELELEVEDADILTVKLDADLLTVDDSYRFPPKLPTKQKHTLSISKNG